MAGLRSAWAVLSFRTAKSNLTKQPNNDNKKIGIIEILKSIQGIDRTLEGKKFISRKESQHYRDERDAGVSVEAS